MSQDAEKIADTLAGIVGEMVGGKGLNINLLAISGLMSSGKKLKDQEGAGKIVMQRFMNKIVTKNPEVLDLIFDGLPALAKQAIIRKAENWGGVKDAGDAAKVPE